jgi:hypothetical protein
LKRWPNEDLVDLEGSRNYAYSTKHYQYDEQRNYGPAAEDGGYSANKGQYKGQRNYGPAATDGGYSAIKGQYEGQRNYGPAAEDGGYSANKGPYDGYSTKDERRYHYSTDTWQEEGSRRQSADRESRRRSADRSSRHSDRRKQKLDLDLRSGQQSWTGLSEA